MRICKKDLDALDAMIRARAAAAEPCLAEQFAVYRERGLSPQRARWDVLWSVPREDRQPWFDRVYAYADDGHVDTALRTVMMNLGYSWAAAKQG